jgi:hypothetical protein
MRTLSAFAAMKAATASTWGAMLGTSSHALASSHESESLQTKEWYMISTHP